MLRTPTYAVQTMEMAAKLAKMSGTNDGRYNGLPIEVCLRNVDPTLPIDR